MSEDAQSESKRARYREYQPYEEWEISALVLRKIRVPIKDMNKKPKMKQWSARARALSGLLTLL